MSRINTNVTSLISQRVLKTNNTGLNQSLERLSTGLKINKGADNPAGLIASENLRSEKTGIGQAINNAERASNIIGTAEGGLGEVSSLLNDLQGLVNEAANSGGLSAEETDANQLQVDSILSTINRIAGTTSFQGKKLLNGNLDYQTANVGSGTANLKINAAKVIAGADLNVAVAVTNSAETGKITRTGAGIVSGQVTLEVIGNQGAEQLTFASGTTTSSVITAVNAVKESTGVSAAVVSGNLSFNSTNFGSREFVSVKALSGTFTTSGDKDFGTNASVQVNGAAAETYGKSVTYRTQSADIQFDLSETANAGGTATFQVTGGGATFSLGAKVTEADKASIGIGSVSTGSLGNDTQGYLNSIGAGGDNSLTGDNLVKAQKIVDSAVKQVAELRGRLGAFQKFTVGATVNSLGVALENASAAESAIRDTDFAAETANLTRSQILSQAATSILSQANAAPQAALRLLQ